ncbi:MAG: ABC transporter ATP-binding protein [Erysipelotrichaceae bacterium]|nr:ABC transporter ATP-binding protein [Erysipelotrichaceae bacterium]
MLSIENITKSFGEKEVLENVCFKVEDGSIFGLVGINGAGKSTLLRVISGVYTPEQGAVLLNGRNTGKDPSVRKEILYVSDDPYYPYGSTIESMKLYFSSFYDLDEEAYKKYLNMFHLDPKVSISNFSKGMKRQASLLFALSVHPKLLLLDEAFDGLDPLVRLNFKKALAELIDEKQVSVIISSHSLKELEDICDSFGILEDHRMSTYGDLLESKENINKYQLAFNEDYERADFPELDIVRFEKQGRVYQLVIRGNEESVRAELEKKSPLLVDVLPVNFEELFIYEVANRNEVEHE